MKYIAPIFCFLFLFIGCSVDGVSNGAEPHWISTESDPGYQPTETEKKLQGRWFQHTEECLGMNRHDPPIKWNFDKGKVRWKNITHTCVYRNDTLFIGGEPYSVQFRSQEEVAITSLSYGCRTVLTRK